MSAAVWWGSGLRAAGVPGPHFPARPNPRVRPRRSRYVLDETTVARELAAIGERLRMLASNGDDRDNVAQELGAIRAHLRTLAQENAEVAARLGTALGLEPGPPPTVH
jgi:hypothetical protein